MAQGGIGVSDVIRNRNPECEALIKSYPTLVENLARSPGTLVDKLIPFTIFSKEEESRVRSHTISDMEKGRLIMKVVQTKVKSMPLFLHNFITIMEKEDWLKHCTDDLKDNLEASKDTAVKSATNPNLDAQIMADLPPIDDIYSLVNNKESPLGVEKCQFDEKDLENRTTRIQQKFASVVTNVAMALKHKNIHTDDLVLHLSQLKCAISDNIRGNEVLQFCDATIKEIEERCQSNVHQVFIEIQRYYSWINFGLIESIIDGFLREDKSVQALWAEYQKKFQEYCRERVCKIPKPLNGLQTFKQGQKNKKVAFKIDYGWHEIRFDRLDNIRADITRMLGLKPYTLYLSTIKQGCVELVFRVPQHVADVIFPPTEKQLQSLQEHNIRYIAVS